MSADRLSAHVRVILRNENQRLGSELLALTGFSISRAMDSVEGALDPEARRRITCEIIAPLEAAREGISFAMERAGSSERLVLAGNVADLCRYQYQALCAALGGPDFPFEQLPVELSDPVAARARFYRAAGLPLPKLIASVEPSETPDDQNNQTA